MARHLNYSGFVIAGIGFVLTRFTVTLAIYEDPMRFYLAGVVPLALGLGLAAFGVVLAVADVDASVVRTTAVWCAAGAGGMIVLAALTLIGAPGELRMDAGTIQSHSYLSTFLIGGSIGGTLTGLYAARNRRQRTELEQQANRLTVLNHMLRHKILNALTPIRGFAAADPAEKPRAEEIVESRTADIEETVDEVRYFTNRTGVGDAGGVRTSLAESVDEAIATVQAEYPAAEISIEGVDDDVAVQADDHLSLVIGELLENAVLHAQDDSPRIEVVERGTRVRVSVVDGGPGLPADQQALLETGKVEDGDRLDLGFGLDLVRLFAESYRTTIETDVSDDGTRVTLVLPSDESDPTTASTGRVTRTRSGITSLAITFVASLVAGVFYGIATEALGGSVSGIGVFYGTAGPIVGWLTHEFHSVVFGFVFLSLLALVPDRYRGSVLSYLAVGLGWGLFLWLFAAGFVAPIWLQLIGIPASLPNLTVTFLVAHVVWGLALGGATAVGHRFVLPWLAE